MTQNKYISMCIILASFSSLFTFSHASERPQQVDFEEYAKTYLDNSKDTEYWKGKNPQLSWESLPLFVWRSEKPSYTEFQVSCDTTPECGFLLVNIDGNDVMIPISGTLWVGPARALTKKWEEEHTKVYYFWPFEQYSKNEKTGEVYSIDPTNYLGRKADDEEVQKEIREELYGKLEEVNMYVNTHAFKKQIEKIQGQYYSLWEVGQPATYTKPPQVVDTFISSWTEPTPDPSKPNKAICRGKVPCYHQHVKDYVGLWIKEPKKPSTQKTDYNCKSGCVPVAAAIIFGYHARQHGKTALFIQKNYSSVPLVNKPQVEYTIDLLRWIVGTECVILDSDGLPKTENDNSQNTPPAPVDPFAGKWWSTNGDNIDRLLLYAQAMGYMDSEVYFSWVQTIPPIFSAVKQEIDKNRPIMLLTSNHAIVAYGYSSNEDDEDDNEPVVVVNLGWWPSNKIIVGSWDNEQIYYTSAINYNLNSVVYNNKKQMVAWYVTFKINQ